MLNDHFNRSSETSRSLRNRCSRTCVSLARRCETVGAPLSPALIDCVISSRRSMIPMGTSPSADEVIQLLCRHNLREASNRGASRPLASEGDEFAVFSLASHQIAAVEQFAVSCEMKGLVNAKSSTKNTRDPLFKSHFRSGNRSYSMRADSEESWHERATDLLTRRKNLGGDRIVNRRKSVSITNPSRSQFIR